MSFCACHPSYEPTETELDIAVERYLAERPSIARGWDDGFPGAWSGNVSVESARDVIRFWATHLTDADRNLRGSRPSVRIDGIESPDRPLLSEASMADVQARLAELERCRGESALQTPITPIRSSESGR